MSQTKESCDIGQQTNNEDSAKTISTSTKNTTDDAINTEKTESQDKNGASVSIFEECCSNKASFADSSAVAAAKKGGVCDNDQPDLIIASGAARKKASFLPSSSSSSVHSSLDSDSLEDGVANMGRVATFENFFETEDSLTKVSNSLQSAMANMAKMENIVKNYVQMEDSPFLPDRDFSAIQTFCDDANNGDKCSSNSNKEEVVSWADGMIDRLHEEIAVKEIEVEQLTEGMVNKAAQEGDYVEQIKGYITMHQFHIDHLELISTRLKDGQLEASNMGDIRASLDCYITAYEDGGYLAACQKGFYDSLRLDDDVDYAGGALSTTNLSQNAVLKPLQSDTLSSHSHKENNKWPYIGAPLSKLLFNEFISELRNDAQEWKDIIAKTEKSLQSDHYPEELKWIREAELTIKHLEEEMALENGAVFTNAVEAYVAEKGYTHVCMMFKNFCEKRNLQKRSEDNGGDSFSMYRPKFDPQLDGELRDGDSGFKDRQEGKDSIVSFLCEMMDEMNHLTKLDVIEQRNVTDPVSIAECQQRIGNHKLHSTNLSQIMNLILDDQLRWVEVTQSFREDLKTYIANCQAGQTFEETKTPGPEAISEMYVKHGFDWLASNGVSNASAAFCGQEAAKLITSSVLAPEATSSCKKRNLEEAASGEDHGKKLTRML